VEMNHLLMRQLF